MQTARRTLRAFRGMWAFRPLTSGSLLLITALIITIAAPARAQLSPGDLSSAHEELEGLKKCSNCHQLGKREVGPRCLDCHVEIKAMREGGRGLHAGDDLGQCVDCHVEHHGRDYELVFWPDGRENFKHDVLGYEMTGAHLKLACRQCHNVKNVVDPGKLRGWKKEFDRTYLGLAQDCLSCHADPHAGALTGGPEQKTCTACHGTEAWKPASGFDHDLDVLPAELRGRHEADGTHDRHEVFLHGARVVRHPRRLLRRYEAALAPLALRGDARGQRVPIIVISGAGGADDWKALTERGASGFLVKPVDPDAVLTLVRRLLHGDGA